MRFAEKGWEIWDGFYGLDYHVYQSRTAVLKTSQGLTSTQVSLPGATRRLETLKEGKSLGPPNTTNAACLFMILKKVHSMTLDHLTPNSG